MTYETGKKITNENLRRFENNYHLPAVKQKKALNTVHNSYLSF